METRYWSTPRTGRSFSRSVSDHKNLTGGDSDLFELNSGQPRQPFAVREVHVALIRWEPVTELNTIQNEMNRLFNTFFEQPAQSSRGSAAGRRWLPAMDLVESADHYVLRADLPGVSEEDLNIQLEDNVLTVSGERKAEAHDHQ